MTLTITAAYAPDQDLPSVLLTATSGTGGPSPVPANSRIVVTRIHADGSRHQVLTAADPRVIGGAWTGFDVHSPFNQFITYEVAAAGFVALSTEVFVPSSSVWLMHPSDPDRSVRIPAADVRGIGDLTSPSRAARFQPMSDPGTTKNPPVFISDGAEGAVTGSISFAVIDPRPIRAMLADDQIALINTPGVDDGWDIGWMWVQFDTRGLTNPGGIRAYPTRTYTLPFEEAADPDMSRVSSWTAGEAADYFRSIAVNAGAVKALYANCLAFKTNTRL